MNDRRTLNFTAVDDVIADVQTLRRGYERVGQWTLPQACRHLDRIMSGSMKPGPHPDDTPEQTARKPMLDTMMATGQIPNGLVAPDEMTPAADTPESAIDEFLTTLEQFAAFHGPLAPHRLFGTLPDDVRRRHQLIHCAHHLSYLVPAETRTT